MKELFGLRLIVAPACAAEAARADDAAGRILDRFREVAGDQLSQSAFLAYNRAFHAAVAHLTGMRDSRRWRIVWSRNLTDLY
jgi:DNA-binding GntR family transcriptional regulator